MSTASKYFDCEKPSFDVIFHKYRQRLVLFARKMLGNQSAAEDIVTEILMKYWAKEKEFVNEIAVKTFLDVSTKNACINYKRTVGRESKKEKGYQIICEEFTEPILNKMVRTELILEVWDTVEALAPECKKVMLLAYVKGLSNQEVAIQLEISIHTVKNHKLRGLQKIRERISRLQAPDVKGSPAFRIRRGRPRREKEVVE